MDRDVLEKKLDLSLNNFRKLCLAEGFNVVKIYGRVKEVKVYDEAVEDFIGLRVLLDTEQECYRLLKIMKKEFLFQDYKDYIKHQWTTGYQAIHAYIEDWSKTNIEVQIMTEEMHEANLSIKEKLGKHHWRRAGVSKYKGMEQEIQEGAKIDTNFIKHRQEISQIQVLEEIANRAYDTETREYDKDSLAAGVLDTLEVLKFKVAK